MTYYLPQQTKIVGLILMKPTYSKERMVHSIAYEPDARMHLIKGVTSGGLNGY